MAVVKKKKRASDSIDLIRQDKIYTRAKRRLENWMAQIDINNLVTEVFSLQTTRTVASLKTKTVVQDSIRTIIDSSVDEIATRSRCTTIHMSALKTLIQIEGLTSDLQKYILSHYAPSLKAQGATTITAQKAQIDVYLRTFLEARRDLDYIIKLTNLVIADIDQGSYALRRISDAVELNQRDK